MVALAATLVRLARHRRAPGMAGEHRRRSRRGRLLRLHRERHGRSARSTGDAGVGTHGGSEDHIAIVCGKADHAAAWTFVPPTHVADVARARGLALRDCVERRGREEDRRGARLLQQSLARGPDAARYLERARGAGAIAARRADLEAWRGATAARAAARPSGRRHLSTWRRGSPSSSTKTRESSRLCAPCATEIPPPSAVWRRNLTGRCGTAAGQPDAGDLGARRDGPSVSARLPHRASAPDSAAAYGRSSGKKTRAASRRAGCPSTGRRFPAPRRSHRLRSSTGTSLTWIG